MSKNSQKLITSSDIYPESYDSLLSLGYKIFFTMDNMLVAPPLKKHADIQLCKVGSDTLVVSPNCFSYYTKLIEDYKILKGDTYLSCNYPSDIAYNIIVGDNIAIGNFKYTDAVIKDNLSSKKLINVAQGYAACTCRRISDLAYITSDRGMYQSLTGEKLDVLLIDDSKILLHGFNQGFFGGSSFVTDDGKLLVNGNIKLHKSFEDIKSFTQNYGIEIISLCDKPIMDIGSFVVL